MARIDRTLTFGSFVLDPHNQLLLRAGRRLAMRPRTFAVLRHLVERAGQLVRKEELLEAIWPETHVADTVLKVSISELRSALGDDSRHPTIIETIHRRGYRLIADTPQADSTAATAPPIVGRADALDRLQAHLDAVVRGARRTVFVTGEPGVGKTALVEAFVAGARAAAVLAASGACIEQLGPAEPLASLHAALHAVRRWPAGGQFAEASDVHDRFAETADGSPARSARMVRLLIEAIERAAAEVPLVLVLEDLQWADPATLDAFFLLARRHEPTRLLLIGTYRPGDLVTRGHPLHRASRELAAMRAADDVRLSGLDRAAVQAYVDHRTGGAALPARFTDWLLDRSGGNALALAALLDTLLERAVLRVDADGAALAPDYERARIPEVLREMIDARLDALPQRDRRLLQAASVAGRSFTSAAVATALGGDAIRVDEALRDLTRRGLLLGAGATHGPDGAVGSRYTFPSAIQHEVLIDRVAPGRAALLQARIGRRDAGAGDPGPAMPLTGTLDGGFATAQATRGAARRTLRRVRTS